MNAGLITMCTETGKVLSIPKEQIPKVYQLLRENNINNLESGPFSANNALKAKEYLAAIIGVWCVFYTFLNSCLDFIAEYLSVWIKPDIAYKVIVISNCLKNRTGSDHPNSIVEIWKC